MGQITPGRSNHALILFSFPLALGAALACSKGPDHPAAGSPDAATTAGGSDAAIAGDAAPTALVDAGVVPGGCQWRAHSLGAIGLTSNIAIAVAPSGDTAVVTTRALTAGRDLVVTTLSPAGIVADQAYGFTLEDTIMADSIDAAYAGDGALHIAFANNNANETFVGSVYYSTGPGVLVGIDNGGPLRVTLDPRLVVTDGQVRMAYKQSKATLLSPDTIRLAHGSGTSFAFDEILSAPDLDGFAGSMGYDVDPAGNGHIVAIDPAGGEPNRLLYAEQDGAAWTATEQVLTAGNSLVEASLSSANPAAIHLAAFDEEHLFEVTGHAGSWSAIQTTAADLFGDDDLHFLRALVVDRAGRSHFTWVDSAGNVQYVQVSGGVISGRTEIAAAAAVTNPSSLTLAVVAGQPYVAFVAASPTASERDLFLARCETP